MKSLIKILLLLVITLSSTAFGDDALAEYKKGDYKTAMKLWRPMAEQGYAGAQYALGVMYDNGEGVPEDKVLAYMWWNLAAANCIEDASTNKGIIAKRMTSSQIAEAQKLSRECLRKNYKNC